MPPRFVFVSTTYTLTQVGKRESFGSSSFFVLCQLIFYTKPEGGRSRKAGREAAGGGNVGLGAACGGNAHRNASRGRPGRKPSIMEKLGKKPPQVQGRAKQHTRKHSEMER